MMGRLPPSREEENNSGLKKGPWTPEEDRLLVDYIKKNGHGSWRALPKLAGLNRCGKSCRLRWTNYLRPDIKRGKFTDEEEKLIISMHAVLGNKWSAIAGKLPGRTDNEIKNFWNTHLRKKLLQMGLDPVTHRPKTEHLDLISYLNQLLTAANIITGLTTNTWLNTTQHQQQQQSPNKLQMLQTMLQLLASSSSNNNNNNNNPVPNIESLLLNNNLLPLEPIVPPLPNDLYEASGLNNNNHVSNFQNFDSPHHHHHQQQTGQISPNSTNSCCIMYQKLDDDEQVLIDATNSVPTTPPSFSNSLPNLVSASSPPDECSNANNNNKQMESSNNNNNNDDVMIDPNATFGIWPSDFIYEEANDAYWNGLIGGRESNQP